VTASEEVPGFRESSVLPPLPARDIFSKSPRISGWVIPRRSFESTVVTAVLALRERPCPSGGQARQAFRIKNQAAPDPIRCASESTKRYPKCGRVRRCRGMVGLSSSFCRN
jgi:hypothetical protein